MSSVAKLSQTQVASDRAALARFARALLRDRDAADDAVQDAWVQVLRRYLGASSHRVPWMKVVLRNLAKRMHRTRARRLARDSTFAAALEGLEPAVDEALERLETQRRLAEIVAAIEEPFRSTVLLVFF